MLDLIKIHPDQVRLTPEAARKVERFTRGHFTDGLKEGGKVVQRFKIDRYAPVTIVGTKTHDGHFWVSKIEAVLPALIYGHNGHSLHSIEELWMALTILQHIVRKLTNPESHDRIIPGVGKYNLGYLALVECSVTVRDPGHLFLHGSHLARLKNQQEPTRIYLGQSSYLSTRERAVSIYDKPKEMGKAFSDSMAKITRIEAIVKNSLRLAMDVKATKLYTGAPGEVVATITPETCHAVLRSQLMLVTGFGWGPSEGSLADLHPKARVLACALGNHIANPSRVNMALAAYRHAFKPNPNTYREIERDLKAYAVRTIIPDPMAIIPEELADLRRADVPWPGREINWTTLMRDIGAPTEHDPAIAAAWSQTTMLSKKPVPAELIGPVTRWQLPFLTDPILS
jgi:hypothetical protein